jgi:hypothetical protein
MKPKKVPYDAYQSLKNKCNHLVTPKMVRRLQLLYDEGWTEDEVQWLVSCTDMCCLTMDEIDPIPDAEWMQLVQRVRLWWLGCQSEAP